MPTIAFHRSLFHSSPNRRHVVSNAGLPYFWLADRCHTLLHRLQRADVDHYVQTRAAQRYSVLQITVLPGVEALTTKNAYGLLPFQDGDAQKPIEGYFAHLDYVVLRANVLGIAVAIEVADAALIGTTITADNAVEYVRFLTRRFMDQAVMWVLGTGDAPEDESRQTIWRLMGQEIKTATKNKQLVAYLPTRRSEGQALWCQNEPWLHIAMVRSGPEYSPTSWKGMAQQYAAEPVLPTLEGLACAEDQPDSLGEESGRLSAKQIRRLAYASVFSGGCGFTYRNYSVESCHSENDQDEARTPWKEALFDPAGEELHYLRKLIESRPFTVRVPDQQLILPPASPSLQQCATRADDDDLGGDRGSYAFCYSPDGAAISVDLSRLSGPTVVATWFDPRSGLGRWLGQFPVRGTRKFTPPSREDWVLVLDDSSRNYPLIGYGGDRSMSY